MNGVERSGLWLFLKVTNAEGLGKYRKKSQDNLSHPKQLLGTIRKPLQLDLTLLCENT
jgi:hypothetical protein